MVGVPLDEGQTRARLEPGAPRGQPLTDTIEWYREREPARLGAPGTRQPLALRAAGSRLAHRERDAAGLSCHERDAVPLPHADRLAVPVRAVARELRRRDVEFEEVRVALRRRDRPEIEKLTGQRRVPLLVIEKDAICDSRRIVEHLDWRQSEHS